MSTYAEPHQEHGLVALEGLAAKEEATANLWPAAPHLGGQEAGVWQQMGR